ncbi:MAG: L-serine ammonia-lyase, iron-sulfur-dependent, subunit alpha [Prevotellaceae bacterium]|jgi:L-cysteine desulfidase|nr:L-serine ammonia-lyase, iron-sulfur-dependent, subunit alpha [Prevotellaceae bacterium]
MQETERKQIIALIKREVVPAIGCTEPMAVALCTARACEALGTPPEQIEVWLSANILKNAMGVGIPGTGGMIGLPIAVALGALVGKSEYQLEVLRDTTPEAVEAGKKLIDTRAIRIALKEGITEKLYIEVVCRADRHDARAIISGGHTTFIYIARDGEVLLDKQSTATAANPSDEPALTLRRVYDFATTAPLDEIAFILEARRLNKAAAERSLADGHYGHALGNTLARIQGTSGNSTNSSFLHILSYTSAACDARMAGAPFPVMSNSGSGNQGISATLPVVVYAEDHGATEEQLTRALILSHLTAIYIKQHMGRLSALCGCVVAATGSSCGITYLMGGDYRQISFAAQNMIANLTGMICDGAKPGCALKVSSGVSTAMLSAMLAMEQKSVTSVEGIIEDNVDLSIRNLARIGSEGMNETDRMVLGMMTNKE